MGRLRKENGFVYKFRIIFDVISKQSGNIYFSGSKIYEGMNKYDALCQMKEEFWGFRKSVFRRNVDIHIKKIKKLKGKDNKRTATYKDRLKLSANTIERLYDEFERLYDVR